MPHGQTRFGPVNFLILFCILLGLYTGCISTLEYPRQLQKSEHYQLSIKTSGPLQEATFYVPLPVKNGLPMIDDKSLNEDDFMKTGFSIDFTKTPPGRNLTGPHPGEFSLEGNDPWYLMIHADAWPNGSIGWDVSNVGERYIPSPLFFYNTAYPIGNESILLPKLEFSPPTPRILKKYSDYGSIVYNIPPFSGTQSIMVYANYTNTFQATVNIFVLVEGTNSWRDMDDTNPSNFYLDDISGIAYDEKGWNKFSGTFTVANGEYPDLSSPRWQRIIEENQSSTL
jgi:hypothetical protein